MKHWKEPNENTWFTFVVDGKRIGTVEDSVKCQKEVRRLRNLSGISIVVASDNDMIRARAMTVLPKRIIDKMRQLYIKYERKFS